MYFICDIFQLTIYQTCSPLTSFLSTYCNCTAYWGGHPFPWWALMGQCTLNWRLPRILGCFWCSCRARLGLLAVKSFRTWPAWEGRRVSEVLSWLVRKPGWCQGEEWCLCQESWTAEGLFGKSTVGQVIRSYPLMRRRDSFFRMASPGWKLQQNEAVNYVDALTRQLEVTKHNPVPHCIRLSQHLL